MTTSCVGWSLRDHARDVGVSRPRLSIRHGAAWLCLLGLLLAPWSAQSAAPSRATQSPRIPVRHVIIVEDTANMEARRERTADLVSRLILQGFNGTARRGDPVELWLVDDYVRTNRFAPFRWDPFGALEQSNTAFRFLRDLKSPRPAAVLDAVVPAIAATNASARPTLIYLATSGADSLAGTPYDDAVNQIFFNHRSGMRKSRLPFITVIAAQDGQWQGHGVTPGDRNPFIPPLPPPPPAKTPASASAATNRPARTPPAPLIWTNKPAPLTPQEIERQIREQAAERARTNSPAVVAPPPTPPASPEKQPPLGPETVVKTNASTQIEPAPPRVEPSNTIIPLAESTAIPPPSVGEPTQTSTPSRPRPSVIVEPAVSTQAEPATPSVVPVLSRVSPTAELPPPARTIWRDLLTGIVLLTAAAALLLILVRNARVKRSSLITESLDRGATLPDSYQDPRR